MWFLLFHRAKYKYLNPWLNVFASQELNEEDKITCAACWSFNYNKNAGICRLFYF